MALNKTALATGIKSLQDNLYSDTTRTPEEARTQYAHDLADLIDIFVKSGTVNVTVTTTGTAAAHTGTGTGAVI